MGGLLNSWTFLTAHPVIGLAVFLLVSAGVILAISGGQLTDSIGAMVRVALTFFTTPFAYLRDAMRVIRSAGEAEQDYAHSRAFMLFRLSRLQYLGLLVLCLLVLSSGVTTSLISLYPQAEIEQERALSEQVTQLETELEAANTALASVSAPGYREALQTHRTETRNAYQQQAQSNAALMQSTSLSGPLISQLSNARSADYLERVRGNIDAYMADCPRGYSWRGMTVDTCMQFRAFALELADRRGREFTLAQAATDAETAWRDADSAAQSATGAVASVQGRLETVRQLRSEASLANPEWLVRRVTSSFMGLIMTLFSVIVTVWVGATVISVFSWIILMMRGLELSQSRNLEQARPDPDI